MSNDKEFVDRKNNTKKYIDSLKSESMDAWYYQQKIIKQKDVIIEKYKKALERYAKEMDYYHGRLARQALSEVGNE